MSESSPDKNAEVTAEATIAVRDISCLLEKSPKWLELFAIIGGVLGYQLVPFAAKHLYLPLSFWIIAGMLSPLLGMIVGAACAGGVQPRFFRRLYGIKPGIALRKRLKWMLAGVMACLLMFPVNALSFKIFTMMGVEIHPQYAIKLLRSGDLKFICVILLTAVILAPLAEELFFRRLVADTLLKFNIQFLRRWRYVICALLFTSIHSPMWIMPAVFITGIVDGIAREEQDTLSSVLFHGTYNLCVVICALCGFLVCR